MMNSPDRDCNLCPRLHDFIAGNRASYPGFYNAPVRPFGDRAESTRLLVVGLAPGLRGANRTGRPFTGDYAGDLLYRVLKQHGFTRGSYDRHPEDGLELVGCRITNAVKCVPPENKPTGPEINTCNAFLTAEIAAMRNLRCIVALGHVAHGAVLRSLGLRKSAHKFAHGAVWPLQSGLTLVDSYHCSRYNVNTGRLTPAMFGDIFGTVCGILGADACDSGL